MIDQPGTPAAGRTATGLTARLMGGALLGKALGFVRELMMAQVLGASIVADGFRGALTGVLLPLILLQNDCVPALLIPLHKRWGGQGRVIRRFTALPSARYVPPQFVSVPTLIPATAAASLSAEVWCAFDSKKSSTAPQSEVTNPLKSHCLRRTSSRRNLLAHAGEPSTAL